MTIAQLPPFDLRAVYPWMQPDAVFAAHFKQGQYWLDDAKGPIAASSLLTTTRSSSIVLPDSAGVFQTLGNNTLPRTDRGLYVNGQYGIENYSSVDFSASSAWTNAASFSVVAVSSVFFGQSAYRHTGNNQDSQNRSQSRILSSAGIIRISAIIEQVSATSFDIGIAVRSPSSWIGLGRFTWSTGLIETAAGNIADSEVQNLGTGPNGGALRLITFTVDTGAVTDTTMRVYPNGIPANTNQTIVHFVGYQYPAIPLQPPAISPNNAKFTTMASDIRAVQGVRPSNGQPEPFPGWEAAGLDAGFAVLMDLDDEFVLASVRRAIEFRNADNHHVRISTLGNGVTLAVGVGVPANTNQSFPGSQAGGRTRVAFSILSDGSLSVARKGSATVSVANNGFPSEISYMAIGSWQASLPWNDWIYSAQICQPLSDAQLLEWVNA